MITVIIICVVILIVYGLVIWGLLKFHRWHLKRQLINIVEKTVKEKGITEEDGNKIKYVINDIYKKKY